MVLPPVEPVSLSLGVLALASLFTTCLECFEMIELGRNFSRDFEIVITKLESQRLIFSIWGNSVGLDNNGKDFHHLLQDPDIKSHICKLLNCIFMLFQDAEKLTKLYGVKQTPMEKTKVKALKAASTIFTDRWDVFRSRLVSRQKHTKTLTKSRWAIHDKNKFTDLVAELKGLIDQLRDITAFAADIKKQRKVFVEEISSVSDVASLELLEEALKEDDPELSEVASQCIVQLTNGSTNSYTLASKSIYATAPSTQSHERDIGDEESPEIEIIENSSNSLAFTEAPIQPMVSETGDIIFGYQNNLKAVQKKDRQKVAKAAFTRIGHWSEKAVFYQLRQISKCHDLFISIAPFDGSLYELLGSMQGPAGTPYEGGVFFLRVDIPRNYPLSPPKCRFITPIYHPNIDRDGRLVVSILEWPERQDLSSVSQGWEPIWTLEKILIGICSLLDDPNFLQPLVPELAKQYGENPVAFEAQARIFTQRYARGNPPSAKEFLVAAPEPSERFLASRSRATQGYGHDTAESAPLLSPRDKRIGVGLLVWLLCVFCGKVLERYAPEWISSGSTIIGPFFLLSVLFLAV